MSPLKKLLLTLNASISSREKGVAFIEANPTSFDELFDLVCAVKNTREHIVAAWVFERLILKKIDSLTPRFDKFLIGAKAQTHESKRRPLAKVLFHYCDNNRRKPKTPKPRKSARDIIKLPNKIHAHLSIQFWFRTTS